MNGYSKRTPGSWQMEAPNGDIRVSDKHLLHANLDLPIEERWANAQFIVTACRSHEDLVTALREIASLWPVNLRGTKHPGETMANYARTALAKLGVSE